MLRHLSQRQRNVLLLGYLVLGTLAWVLLDTRGLIGVAVGTLLAATLLDLHSRRRSAHVAHLPAGAGSPAPHTHPSTPR